MLFQAIQFSISSQFSSIYPIEKTLSGASTPDQSRPGSDSNEGVLHVPQSPCITGTSPSDCFVSYPGDLLGESYPSAKKQSVYSTAPAEGAINFLVLWVICLRSSLTHFKNEPEYLTRSWGFTDEISPTKFGFEKLYSTSEIHFSLISACLMVNAFSFPKCLYFSFFPSVLMLSC